MADTIGAAFAAAVAPDPARPLLTYYDEATGERTELSGATLANWVAKTANLLVDGLGLGAGSTAAVDLPPHWQTAAVLLGCWSAGVTVSEQSPADVAFAAAPFTATADEVYGLGLAPMGLPMREVPPGVLDYAAEVRTFGDHFPGAPAVGPALPGVSHADLLAGLPTRPGRLLFDAAAHRDPTRWLLGPLLAGGSIVLAANASADRLTAIAETERAAII